VLLPINSRRIRSLESHVAEIRATQTSIQASLQEIAFHLRTNVVRSPSLTASFQQPSPSLASPTISTPPRSQHHLESTPSVSSTVGVPGVSGSNSFTPDGSTTPMMNPAIPRQSHDSSVTAYRGATGLPSSQISEQNSYGSYSAVPSGYSSSSTVPPPMLPPFSIIGAIGSHQSNGSSARSHPTENDHSYVPFVKRRDSSASASSSKRRAPPSSSNAASAESSDYEDEDDLPDPGLVAPWKVLMGLAEVAVQANKVCFILVIDCRIVIVRFMKMASQVNRRRFLTASLLVCVS
jgi:hypothetical protein